jgi:hypothetical protein
MGMPQDEALRAEWSRAQAAGRGATRKKAVATAVSVTATAVVVIVGYVVLYAAWPFDRIPVLFLTLPWLPALPMGLVLRQKLWPRGPLGS